MTEMRHVHENIQLDQSLRQSRSIWLALAVVFLPGAAIGIFRMLFDLAIIFGSGDDADMSVVQSAWNFFWSLLLIFLDVFLFGRVREASRRLRLLHDDPSAKIRPLPAPFLASYFGPYH
jgi:hypothetical protein